MTPTLEKHKIIKGVLKMKKNNFFKAVALMFIGIFLAGNLAAAYAGTDYVSNSNKTYKDSLVQPAQNTPSIAMMSSDGE